PLPLSPATRPCSPSFSTPPPPPQLYPLSLHDALPISRHGAVDHLHRQRDDDGAEHQAQVLGMRMRQDAGPDERAGQDAEHHGERSEEHTSELQSLTNLVCRLLLEKKKKQINNAVSEQY